MLQPKCNAWEVAARMGRRRKKPVPPALHCEHSPPRCDGNPDLARVGCSAPLRRKQPPPPSGSSMPPKEKRFPSRCFQPRGAADWRMVCAAARCGGLYIPAGARLTQLIAHSSHLTFRNGFPLARTRFSFLVFAYVLQECWRLHRPPRPGRHCFLGQLQNEVSRTNFARASPRRRRFASLVRA